MGGCCYIFFGKVLPERALVDVSRVKFRARDMADVSDGELHVGVSRSQVLARFVTPGSVDNLETLRNMVEDAVRSLLDVYGYCKGYGYDVEITQAVDAATGNSKVFGVGIGAVADSAGQAGIEFMHVWRLTQTSGIGEYLLPALADLREATKNWRQTGFHCYRAIESLMNSYASRCDPTPKNGKAWELFRETYSIDESDIRFVKAFADPVRHGEPPRQTTDSDRAAVFVHTWNIVNQFVLGEVDHTAPGTVRVDTDD